MRRQIAVKSYRRRFREPLLTASGEWAVREGFVLRWENDGVLHYGEVAPLPGHGSETMAAAATFLGGLVVQPDLAVPEELPCCAFALGASLPAAPARAYQVAALLPVGVAALAQADVKLDLGYTTLKWKVGVEPLAEELSIAYELITHLPEEARLRIDANASLSTAATDAWLHLLNEFPGRIDFLEQPMAVGRESEMRTLSASSAIPIALDESLHGADGLRWIQADEWAGPLVVKVPLMGDCGALYRRLLSVADRLVVSSVFETGIGLEQTLRLLDHLPESSYAIGFDTVGAFDDGFSLPAPLATITPDARAAIEPELIWKIVLHSN